MKEISSKLFMCYGCVHSGKTLFYNKLSNDDNIIKIDFRSFLEFRFSNSLKEFNYLKKHLGIKLALKLRVNDPLYYNSIENMFELYNILKTKYPKKHIIFIPGKFDWFKNDKFLNHSDIINFMLIRDLRLDFISYFIDKFNHDNKFDNNKFLYFYINAIKNNINEYKKYSKYMLRINIEDIHLNFLKYNILAPTKINGNKTTEYDHNRLYKISEDFKIIINNSLKIINRELKDEIKFLNSNEFFNLDDYFDVCKKDIELIKGD